MGTYKSQEPIYKNRFGLPKAVGPEDGLQIVRGVPASVKDHHSIGGHQINT